MNISTLRKNYVEKALSILGHDVPGFESEKLPALTNKHVLDRLGTFPDLILRVRALQGEQESLKPADEVQEEVQAFCRGAGRRLVRACTAMEGLLEKLNSYKPDAAFSHHLILVHTLLYIRESLAFWGLSINAKEFHKTQARSREVRFRYVEHTLRLVIIIVDMLFPEDLRHYVEGLEEVLGWPELQKQVQFDNAATYLETKEQAIKGITAPRLMKRFIPYGMEHSIPYWYLNPSVYGHAQQANQLCILTVPRRTYYNMGRFNDWDAQ